MASQIICPATEVVNASDVEFLCSLNKKEIRDWVVSELRGEHLLTSIKEDVLCSPDFPIHRMVLHYYLCSQQTQMWMRRSVVDTLRFWIKGSDELSGGPGLRHLFTLIRGLGLREAQPYLLQVMCVCPLLPPDPDEISIHMFNAAAELTCEEEIRYWKLIAEQSPHYRHLILVIVRRYSLEDALEIAQTIDYRNIYVVDYLERVLPNFRDYIISPGERRKVAQNH